MDICTVSNALKTSCRRINLSCGSEKAFFPAVPQVAESSAAEVVSLETAEAGLVNPSFEEAEDDLPQRVRVTAEMKTTKIHLEDTAEELRMRIARRKDAPLGNIVQEELQDSVIAADE